MRGPAFFAYADNYLVDVSLASLSTSKPLVPSVKLEAGAAKTMIERTEERFDLKPAYLAADTAYGSAERGDFFGEGIHYEPVDVTSAS